MALRGQRRMDCSGEQLRSSLWRFITGAVTITATGTKQTHPSFSCAHNGNTDGCPRWDAAAANAIALASTSSQMGPPPLAIVCGRVRQTPPTEHPQAPAEVKASVKAEFEHGESLPPSVRLTVLYDFVATPGLGFDE